MQYINSREGMASWTEHTLPPLVIKQLNDKMYEKRKSGALEIEK